MSWRDWWQRRRRRAELSPSPSPAGLVEATGQRPRRSRQRRPGHRREHPAFTRDALRRAWRRVRASGGGAGVDGQDIAAFEQGLSRRLEDLRAELQSGDYRPRAVRRVFVPKPNGGLRPLAVWALRDRVAQRAVYDFLEPHFEPQFMDCSHGFRPRRSVQTATQAVLAARDDGLTSVLDADIKDCFDRIDSRRLVGIIRHRVHDDTVLTLLERWLAADILDQRGRRTAAGAAQGGVLSPLLCNIYLHPFDRALTGRRIRLVRYADDLVCFSHSKGQVQEARGAVELELGKLGLALHPQKTRLSSFEEGFAFLGVFFLRHEHFILAPGATWRADAGRSGGSLKRKVR